MQLRSRRYFISLAPLLLSAALCFCASPQSMLQETIDRFRKAERLQFHFTEQYLGEGGFLLPRPETGEVYLQKPDLIRWEYHEPEEKLFISDGKHVYFHIPADRVVYRSPSREHIKSQPLLRFLLQDRKLANYFEFLLVEETQESYTFRAESKKKPDQGPKFLLTLYLDEPRITLAFFDETDNLVQFDMADLDYNPNFDGIDFEFTVPAGTEVISGKGVL